MMPRGTSAIGSPYLLHGFNFWFYAASALSLGRLALRQGIVHSAMFLLNAPLSGMCVITSDRDGQLRLIKSSHDPTGQ